MNKRVKCDLCGQSFPLLADQIVVKNVEIEGEVLTCTFLECRICEGKSLKQIDNQETLDLRNQMIPLKGAEMMMGRGGKSLQAKKKTRMLLLGRKLENKRQLLNRRYWTVVDQLESK